MYIKSTEWVTIYFLKHDGGYKPDTLRMRVSEAFSCSQYGVSLIEMIKPPTACAPHSERFLRRVSGCSPQAVSATAMMNSEKAL